jgi:hypothetical protein
MSRSGYSDDYCDDQWAMICWRGAVKKAMRGKKGQRFLREMLAALDRLGGNRRLIAHDLEAHGAVCAIGAVGAARGLDMSKLDPEDRVSVAYAFGIAPALVAEIVYENDEGGLYNETPSTRYARMRRWIESQIILETAKH